MYRKATKPGKVPAAIVTGVLIIFAVLARESRRMASFAPAAVEDGVSVYFSPKGGCENAVVEEIAHAQHTIDMQAYSFTSRAIGDALADAQSRGIKVRAILDSKAAKEEYREPQFIASHGIETYIDADHPIAHNKVIIIDRQTVVTGSFNFTQQAEEANAENLLVLANKSTLAAAYESNFEQHLSHSQPYGGGQ